MDIQIHIDGATLGDILTWTDIEIIESRNTFACRPLIAKFVVDGRGRKIPEKEALEKLGKLTMNEIRAIVAQFYTLFAEAVVNPTTGDELNPPSEAVEASPSGGDNSPRPATGRVSRGRLPVRRRRPSSLIGG